MGKISMKAVQQEVFNLTGTGEKEVGYVLRPSLYSTIDSNQIVEHCAQNSMVPKAYIGASMIAIMQCIQDYLLNGHRVVIPELGTFALTAKVHAVDSVEKAGLDQLEKFCIRFLPSPKLKREVESVDVELEGIYDIAGETFYAKSTDERAERTRKIYKKVQK